MKDQQKLVLQHLENISWKVLEEYPGIIRAMIRGKWGVYALYRKDKLYYEGLANNLMGRLKTHLKDRHHNLWDRFSVYLIIKSSHIKELESLLIRVTNPPGNRMKGKFSKSQPIKSVLNELMKNYDADKRAGLIGGVVAKRRQKSIAKKAVKTKTLKGIFNKRVRLKGIYKGEEYFATLRKDGTISFKNEIYKSPTGAAKVIVKRTVSGWFFWRYKNDKNVWVRLNRVRK